MLGKAVIPFVPLRTGRAMSASTSKASPRNGGATPWPMSPAVAVGGVFGGVCCGFGLFWGSFLEGVRIDVGYNKRAGVDMVVGGILEDLVFGVFCGVGGCGGARGEGDVGRFVVAGGRRV